MDPKDFVHLHVHSHYSLLEALPSPKALVERAKSQGATALALTDNAALYGAVEFYQKCEAAEIKPIIGLDVFVALDKMTDKRAAIDKKNHRLTLIARNDVGYKNLLKISTSGFIDGFYYKPRIDKDFLREHGEGITVLTGGVAGEIPELLLGGDTKKAKETLEIFQEIFGKEYVYLELVHHPDFPRQVEANDMLKAFAKEVGAQMVCTKNIFYLNPEDREGYEAQLCIQRSRTLEEFRRTSVSDTDLSMSDPKEIIEAFSDVPEALSNTKKIADSVNFKMDLGNNYLPIFPMPEGKSDNEYMRDLALKGLKERYAEITPEVMERFEFEYETIKRMGYSSYFIIVADFVTWAKDQGILVGPGRGSAAGSIMSYAMRITDLDPLKYGLLFERFLNPDRVSMPDVDMDFADSRRSEVLKYVQDKYGEDRVAGIITFGKLMPRAAVRDAARVLGLSYDEADIIAKAVPQPVQGRHIPLAIAQVEHPDLADLLKGNPMARRVVELAKKFEGNPRHTSQHACGFVIGDLPLIDRVPLKEGQREDTALITQYSLDSAESVGLVKMDFLGLSNLTIIENALEIIKAVHNDTIDIDTIPLDDQKTFDLLGRGDTIGVFQLESDGMRRYIKELKPTEFEDIVAMVSLYRPGPLSAGMVPMYINRKNGREKVVYDHPLMEEILKETYGVTIYQEQIMKISRALAGFTAGEADFLRKAMGKKKRDVLAKMYDSFIDGCVKNGVKKSIAAKIWKDWEGFADYAFNKSHAACYALIAYRTAYLKARYPSEFMAAVMNSDINTIDRITIEVEECKRIGIKVLSPDVNESYPGFAVVPETGNIRWGLSAIKNVGYEVGKSIQVERKENGLYEDLADFASRLDSKQLNKKSLDALAKSGALDSFGDRSQIVANIDQILLFNRQAQKDKIQNQTSMFDLSPTMETQRFVLREVEPMNQEQLLAWERELLGIYVSSHPASLVDDALDGLVVKAATLSSRAKDEIVCVGGVIVSVKKILTKKKQEPMAFVRLEDGSGSAEIVVFPKMYSEVQSKLVEGSLALIQGKVAARERNDVMEWSLLCDQLHRFTQDDIPEVVDYLKRGNWPTEKQEEDTWMDEAKDEGIFITIPEKPTHDMITKLRSIFVDNPGADPVYLLVTSGSRARRVATEYSVRRETKVLDEIAEIVGAGNVR
ncbi:DNA polymerase III subunit alpha [Candidatus Uhrbacteria bacterium]|jgi:DNA polymerase III subunit alpha|nr:DNA polymerase III subunit alpha [Candidatus Uhrbacteria bacterium]